MPTIVGILTFMSGKNFMLSGAEHEKSFITLGPGCQILDPYDLQLGMRIHRKKLLVKLTTT